MGSTKVKHELFRTTLENFFAKCRLVMLQNYDDQKLTANAFMIKEMGDGFLCSVGFPFSPVENSKAEAAVKLSQRFVREFTNFMLDLAMIEPVFCSVGISFGTVEGIFSTEGIVRYDIFGDAVVMATRYEAMRKEIFGTYKLTPSNIITIQERVFESLTPELREAFVAFDLSKVRIQVKDDPAAKRLYFGGLTYEKNELEAS